MDIAILRIVCLVLFSILCLLSVGYYALYMEDGGEVILSYSSDNALRTATCCDHFISIPRVVFQSSNTDNVVRRYMEYRGLVTKFNNVRMYVYNNSVVDHYMYTYHITSVARAYRRITKGAIKADLFRWAYAYEYGGIWMDMDTWTRGIMPVSYTADELVVIIQGTCIQAHFFAARAYHPVIKHVLLTAASNINNGVFDINHGDCHIGDAAGWAGPTVITNVIHGLLGTRVNTKKYKTTRSGTIYDIPYTITIINQDYTDLPIIVHKRWFGAEHDTKKTFKRNNTWSQSSSY